MFVFIIVSYIDTKHKYLSLPKFNASHKSLLYNAYYIRYNILVFVVKFLLLLVEV